MVELGQKVVNVVFECSLIEVLQVYSLKHDNLQNSNEEPSLSEYDGYHFTVVIQPLL